MPPTPPLSYQDAFARHGFLQGYPLWNPAPVLLPRSRQTEGLRIGDVGTIDRDGCFNTFFNICNPRDPALEREHGFPSGFTRVKKPNIVDYNSFPPGHIFSSPETSWFPRSVEAPYYIDEGTVNVNRVITQYTANLSEDGAHIVVPQGAICSKLALQDHYLFQTRANIHWSLWFDFAKSQLQGPLNSLYLITGLCRTRSWALASFNKKDGREVPVSCELVEQDKKLQVYASRWTPLGRFASGIGPLTAGQERDNQTVFIQSFTITSNGVARPLDQEQLVLCDNPDTPPSNDSMGRENVTESSIGFEHCNGSSGNTDTAIDHGHGATIRHIPEVTLDSHPSEIINRYLLNKHPSAEAAVTHDSMWVSMLAEGQLSMLRDLESAIDNIVSEHYSIVLRNGVVYLRNKDVSLARFGVDRSNLPVDLTDCIEQDDEEPFAKHSFGAVYRGRLCIPQGSTVKVAIKIVTINPTNNINLSGNEKRVQRMVESFSTLDHINVLPLVWAVMEPGRVTLVYPWAESGTLTRYIDSIYDSLTDMQILTLIHDVAAGLHYLHSKDILHGSLSGSGIVIDANGTALLSDFGLSTLVDAQGSPLFDLTGWGSETMRWIAPEPPAVESGNVSGGVLTKERDIYSFGSVMLQILSGKVPYCHYEREEDVLSAIYRQETPERPRNRHVTDGRWRFIQRCWSSIGTVDMSPSSRDVVEFAKHDLELVTLEIQEDISSSQSRRHSTTGGLSYPIAIDPSCPRPPVASRSDSARGEETASSPRPPSIRSAILDGSQESSVVTVSRSSLCWSDTRSRNSSRALPRVLSREIQLHANQQVVEPSIYDGFDLQYIFSRHSEGSIYSAGSRLSYVQGATGPHADAQRVFLQARSSISLPFTDTFMRFLQKHEEDYGARHSSWTFQREKVDVSTSSSRRRQRLHHRQTNKLGEEPRPTAQEVWQCAQIGRFKVEKPEFKSRPATRGQQRIHIRHIPGPFLVGNTTSGLHSVIHKHLRATAFSIFRSCDLFSGPHAGRTGTSPTSIQTHLIMHSGIMLAPKKVQEQYTSTKTTRQLSTYGLLDSGSRTQSPPFHHKGKGERERNADGGKGKAADKGIGKDKIDEKHHRTTSTEWSEPRTERIDSSATEHVVLVTKPSSIRASVCRPVSPTSSLPPSVIDSSDVPNSETSLTLRTRHNRNRRGSLDSEDSLPVRTTHAEAFSTLGPNDVEDSRTKINSRANADSGPTFARRFLRVLGRSSELDDHSSSTQPRSFQPPWLTTVSRDQQEEDLVLDDLNASFKAVGMLSVNRRRRPKAVSKPKSNQGILNQIPDDCPFMLLPLWPSETDPKASNHVEIGSAASFVTLPENRQYLLVYYAPFVEPSSKDKKSERKKVRQSRSSGSHVKPGPNGTYLPTFRVVARVVAYDELQLSGVRIPSDGLTINNDAWEAMKYSAHVSTRDAQMNDIIVCQCLDREGGFDFLEEGLLRLGLCARERLSPQDPLQHEGDEQEDKVVLTPIGRAAVEMIWFGCLAVTSFGPA